MVDELKPVIFPSQVNLKIRDILGVHGQSDIFPGRLQGELQAVIDVTKFLNPELGSFPDNSANFAIATKNVEVILVVPDGEFWLVTHIGGRTTSTNVLLGEELYLTANMDPTDTLKKINLGRELCETTLTNLVLGYTMEKGIIMRPGSSFSLFTTSGFANVVGGRIYAEVIVFTK